MLSFKEHIAFSCDGLRLRVQSVPTVEMTVSDELEASLSEAQSGAAVRAARMCPREVVPEARTADGAGGAGH